jgi:hypothetical protein
MMNRADDQLGPEQSGSLLTGIGIAMLCQFAHLLFVYNLSSAEVRVLGYLLFALLQFAYLLPLALFFRGRNQGFTSNGVIIAGAFSLLAEAAWFGYAAMNGVLPAIPTS